MRHFSLSVVAIGWLAATPFFTATAWQAPAFVTDHNRTPERMQPELVCLDPSVEFPVACDEDDD